MKLLVVIAFLVATQADEAKPEQTNAEIKPIETAPKAKEVVISPGEFCLSCHTFIEEFWRFTRSNLKNHQQSNFNFGPDQILQKFCEGPPISDFHDFYKFGCIKLAQENLTTALAPFAGSHDATYLNSQARVHRHKTDFCTEVKACPKQAPAGRRDKCERCKTVVTDMAKALHRPKFLLASKVLPTAEAVCADLPLRHDRPEELEETCFDFVQEYGDDIHKHLLVSKLTQKSSKLQPPSLTSRKQTPLVADEAHQTVCVKLLHACAEPKIKIEL